jgi:hypothetical protein
MASGTLTIHRLGGRYRDAARAYKVLVDGQETGKIKSGNSENYALAPGNHVVRMKVDWCRSQDVEVTVPEGGAVELRCKPSAGAWRAIYDVTIGATKYIVLEPGGPWPA